MPTLSNVEGFYTGVRPLLAAAYDPLATYERFDIRRFTNAALQEEMASILADMRDTETVAVVGHHIYNQDGTRVANVTKLSAVVRDPFGVKGFSLMAGGFKDWTSRESGAEGKIVFRR